MFLFVLSLYGSNKDPQGWMYKKTVIKQLSKTLPKDYYGKRGISVDDKVEGGGYLKLDDDNNIMFVEGKKIIPKRSKSIYSNLDIDVEPLEISNLEIPKFKLLSAFKTIPTSVISPFVVYVNIVGFVTVDACIDTPTVPMNVSAVKSYS